MNLILACVLAIGLVTTPACSSSKKKASELEMEGTSGSHPVRPTALAREAAHLRARQISRVTYNLWFGLDDTHEDYEGRAVIQFDLKPQGKDLSKTLLMDFEEGTLRTITLNGQSLLVDERYDGHRISFKTNELRSGNNRIEIAFTHGYSHNGAGLHRFKDPVDGLVYLYSDFEPYDAHRMFPCFDQPDLKASYELTVEAPEKWQVIANTPERDVVTVDGRKSWQFPPSPLFSTYVFALHAGPYALWKADAAGIPTRLFARQSVKEYVDYQEWLDVTKRGLDYFSVYFGYPYPYAKYDQIIVPDFNAGAMENVAAVTFSERYIYRSKVTQDVHRWRASTILHEMAHMWFGDLVTMRWWNGLWLNESFATFMATKAVDEATEFKGGWQGFFSRIKQSAYREDELVTTHPIEGPVFDTDHASTIFDGITYGKGAAALKQLNAVLGDDDFREGLQRYFQKFALRNTTVTDFIKMLTEASSRDLLKWQKSWLQSSGVNTVRAEWTCTDAGKIGSFQLLQSAPELKEAAQELRTHHTEVAFYKVKGGKLQADKTFTVLYSAAVTPIPEVVGTPCPDLVYPNHKDLDYVKVELDPISLKRASGSMAKIADPFARQMIWHNLWEMVADGKLRAQDYITTVLSQGARETNTQILSRILKSLVDPSLNASAVKFLDGKTRAEWALKVEKFVSDHLLTAPPGSDLQLIWFHSFLDAAHSEPAIARMKRLLTGKGKLSGLKIDQERRWELIQALARCGAPDSLALIAAELKLDATDMGQKAAIAAEVAIPNGESKARWLAQILKQEQPFPKLREAMRAFHALGQEELSRAAVDSYFEMIPKLSSMNDEEFTRRFASSMYPALCDSIVVQKTTAALAAHPNLPAQVVKILKVGRQEEERCIRARAKATEAPASS